MISQGRPLHGHRVTYATFRKVSTCRSHWSNWFQLAKFRLADQQNRGEAARLEAAAGVDEQFGEPIVRQGVVPALTRSRTSVQVSFSRNTVSGGLPAGAWPARWDRASFDTLPAAPIDNRERQA
jgi:hypothetical protein